MPLCFPTRSYWLENLKNLENSVRQKQFDNSGVLLTPSLTTSVASVASARYSILKMYVVIHSL